MADTNCWFELCNIPQAIERGVPVKISENEFIVVSSAPNDSDEPYRACVHKYDTISDHWIELESFHSGDLEHHSITFNGSSTLYASGRYNKILRIDISQTPFRVPSWNERHQIRLQQGFRGNSFPAVLFSDFGGEEKIHIFGGHKNAKHFVYVDNGSNEFQVMADFQLLGFGDNIEGCSLTLLPSKGKMLLIGGWSRSVTRFVGIWVYCLQTQQWTKIECITFDQNFASTALTSNEDYVVISGGENTHGIVDYTYVLDVRSDDVQEFKLKKALHGPHAWEHNIVLVKQKNAELLTAGFIRESFATFEATRLPPWYLLQLISTWYHQEEIHWIEFNEKGNENKHYAITLKHLLSSLS